MMGLGFAATRDIVSFLRHENADADGTPNPLAGRIDRAIGFGAVAERPLPARLPLSRLQRGRGRPHGVRRTDAASRGRQEDLHELSLQPARPLALSACRHALSRRQFPFSYPVTTDALTGSSDGLLARCLAAGNCPKIIKTDTEIEFYQQRASLVVTDTEGNALEMPDNVRLFLLSNLQHAAPANAKSEMTRTCTYPTNPLYAGPPLRALLVALDGWISNGTPPPASRYPSRADGTLVVPTADGGRLPAHSRLRLSRADGAADLINADAMPPTKGAAYPVFVPKTDADGRDIAGLRLPTLEAPVATHTGWNLRKAGFGEGELCDNNGAMMPFAARARSGSRPTIRGCRWRSAIRTRATAPPRSQRPRSNWCRTGCCWKTTPNCSLQTSTDRSRSLREP